MKTNPSQIFDEYKQGTTFKAGLGNLSLYEQNKKNERFFVGDQWYGVNCGNDRPLIRHNVIKRIGDYKMAVIGSSPIAVNYSADGVPNTVDLKKEIAPIRESVAAGDQKPVNAMIAQPVPSNTEITLVMSALSDYQRVTAERLKFNDKCEQALRNAYISGTGIMYMYWDDKVKTGLYADEQRTTPIVGDIACDVLDVENVYFGDPNMDEIQTQPYILVVQRKSIAELKREAKRNGVRPDERNQIKPDRDTMYEAGQMSEDEPEESKKATVITKFWKEYDDNGDYKIKAIKVCENAVVRPEWNLGIRLYPFAKFVWERRRNCAYGESEITYLIPNQVAINRMVTASVWAVMMMGMPIMVVNEDVVDASTISNNPGQIIPINGGINDVQASIRYLNPPMFSPNFSNNVKDIISNTMQQAGATDSALGDMRPENTSAIIALREAATMPLQQTQNRFYSFVEDTARIWAEFWVMQYGKRSIKVEDDSGTWYLPFDGDRYKDLLISTKIDVGASTLWSESQAIRTLDNMLDKGLINPKQYLSRIPDGIIKNRNKLIQELDAMNGQQMDLESILQNLPPEASEAILQILQQYTPADNTAVVQ